MYKAEKNNATNPFISAVIKSGGSSDVEIWPENWKSFDIFETVGTQWRVGFSGATGLDYSAVYPLLDRFSEDPKDWRNLLEDIRVMEAAALNAMRPKEQGSGG